MWVAASMREGQRSSLWTFATDRFCSEPPTFSRRRHACGVLKRHYFRVHVSLGSAETLVRRGGIINHNSMAYSLSNISAKNYRNRLMWVESIVCNISVVFLGHNVHSPDMLRIVFLTSILCDEVDDMLLCSSLQGCQKLDALLFWCQQFQQRVVFSESRSLTANVVGLSSGQNVKTQKFMEQPKVRLNELCKWRLECHNGRQNTGLVICMYHNV